jgi:hypothetical protein
LLSKIVRYAPIYTKHFLTGLDCFCLWEMKQKHVSGAQKAKRPEAVQAFSLFVR